MNFSLPASGASFRPVRFSACWQPLIVRGLAVAVLFVCGLPRATAEFPEPLVADVIGADGEEDDAPVPPVPFDLVSAFAQIRDPAIETVDEQTASSGTQGGGSLGGTLRDRWDRIRDPAIETVDEQT